MTSPEPTAIALVPGDGDEPRWQLSSEPDWKLFEAVRLASVRFEDGRALGVAALRPRGARGHDEDVVIARLVDPEGESTSISEALVSVEYDAEGAPRRLGIELWPDSESAPPLRVAADRVAAVEQGADDSGHLGVPMTFHLEGVSGVGLYELLEAA
jgi:hypothetical protein